MLDFLAKFWVTIIIEWNYLTMSFCIMRGKKQRRVKKKLQKQNEKWQDGGETLPKEKNDNFLGFCLFGVNGQRKRY